MRGSWEDARLFMAKGPSARLEFLDEEQRALLWAYWMQATQGPRSHLDSGGSVEAVADDRLRRRQAAWAELEDMSIERAQSRFIDLLTAAVPDWTTWCDMYGARVKAEQSIGGEEQRLLKAFASKTGLGFSSSRL